MIREDALNFLHENVKNENLRRHCYAVEAVMRSLAKKFGGEVDNWGIAGLLHDADYEITKDEPIRHTHVTVDWLKEKGAPKEIMDAVLAHGWGYVEGNPEPSNRMEWALYTCDELTGLVVAVALVRPDKKIESVDVEAVMKKWDQKSFAKGAKREQIKLCEEKLGIPLIVYIKITLDAMKGISDELGL